ncbi:MAG: 3-hydroxyacyl-CoA dehydrogenase family protein [Gemmatimonadetes bacterium]|nr:3-hydroxyacyl-CoA dehydrogenase family protein [Gemmatimonadota bacterium]
MTDSPLRVAIVGAGTMGHGIAYVAALASCSVTLTDSHVAALEQAQGKIDALLASGVKRGKLTAADAAAIRGRMRTEPDLGAAIARADVVIEAIVENLAVKQRLFAAVERGAPAVALLATNTSSLSVSEIAGALTDPSRCLGLHFFNPVHLMRLLEVVTHARTERGTVDRAVAFARRLGKEPIVVKDSPGFASSRLGVVLGLEAMRMLEQGVASAEDIDKAMELGYNHPMGPLKLTDLVGLDVRLAIAEYLHQTLGSAHYAPPRILRDKVAKGDLGKKTGKGFYTWSG